MPSIATTISDTTRSQSVARLAPTDTAVVANDAVGRGGALAEGGGGSELAIGSLERLSLAVIARLPWTGGEKMDGGVL